MQCRGHTSHASSVRPPSQTDSRRRLHSSRPANPATANCDAEECLLDRCLADIEPPAALARRWRLAEPQRRHICSSSTASSAICTSRERRSGCRWRKSACRGSRPRDLFVGYEDRRAAFCAAKYGRKVGYALGASRGTSKAIRGKFRAGMANRIGPAPATTRQESALRDCVNSPVFEKIPAVRCGVFFMHVQGHTGTRLAVSRTVGRSDRRGQ